MTGETAGRTGCARAAVIRAAVPSDAEAVARLHADSWRRYYRGAYSEAYLGAGLDEDRLALWTERLAPGSEGCVTLVAQLDAETVGFVHVELWSDDEWGALVDNLHVACAVQGRGVGTALLAEAARALVDARPDTPLYLWVLEQNTRAQSFYRARGASLSGPSPVAPPRCDPRNIVGAPKKLRVVWPDPAVLLRP